MMEINTSFAYKMTFVSFLCFLQMVTITFGFPKQDDEPNCYSRFDYEFKVVQKLVAVENAYSELKTTNEVLQREIDNLKSKITGNFIIICFILLLLLFLNIISMGPKEDLL